MFSEEIITKHDLSFISICSFSILYNSNFILTATSLGTNPVVVARVHCTIISLVENKINLQGRNVRKCTFEHVRSAKIQISLRICAEWSITKTRIYNFDPLKPHFYVVKLGFTRVYIIFLIFARKHS